MDCYIKFDRQFAEPAVNELGAAGLPERGFPSPPTGPNPVASIKPNRLGAKVWRPTPETAPKTQRQLGSWERIVKCVPS